MMRTSVVALILCWWTSWSDGFVFLPRCRTPSLHVRHRNPSTHRAATQLDRPPTVTPTDPPKRPQQEQQQQGIVLITGFENFNINLYRKAASMVNAAVPSVHVSVFTDADIAEQPAVVEAALQGASVVFCSLIVDYLQVQWVRQRIGHVPVRFVFESALELMSETKVGAFEMKAGGSGGQAAGPPAPVKALLKQFGSGREEDRMTGYIKFLKIGPKLLKYVPGDRAKDLKTWLTVYSYWSEGAQTNVESMLYTIIDAFGLRAVGPSASSAAAAPVLPAALVEFPQQGLFHPDLPSTYLSSPREYCAWYEASHPWVTADTPRVGILLYRKHVITEQGYIPNMIKLMESNGIMPIPMFINGVEAHTVVRDLFTTEHERRMRDAGVRGDIVLSPECTRVDAVVNTIGFPLVGGPAGSMEGGRQIEAAREILQAKNVPYFVAAPLLIQDADSWQKSGVQGLQTVVLYALPELDGAIETVVLGGLVGGDKIIVLPERVRRLADRLKAWVRLRRTPPAARRLSILLYGFPPNVGAVGTAALLNVGNSLRNLLRELAAAGYDVGPVGADGGIDGVFGERLVAASRALLQGATFAGGGSLADKTLRAQRAVDAAMGDAAPPGAVRARLVEVDASQLRSWLGKDATARMEKQWGDLEQYTGLGVAGAAGRFGVAGLQLGDGVFLGVQPLVGVEGDPMRLMFERDLTPHPQYAAFYKWLAAELNPHCMLHFGMHGTVEWLPGSPLGSTATSWPDMLLGDAPNLYVYACNNPSESLLAKRRGYATIVSHNVPPYARAGLYKELSTLRDLLGELRADGTAPQGSEAASTSSTNFIPVPSSTGSSSSSSSSSSSGSTSNDVIPLVVSMCEKCGIFEDLPYTGTFADPVDTPDEAAAATAPPKKGRRLSAERAEELLAGPSAAALAAEFAGYASALRSYLAELEARLFSEGLHEVGARLSATQVAGYLDACFGPEETGVHRDTLALVAEGAVQLRDELQAAAAGGARGRARRTTTAGLKVSGAATSALLLRAEALQRQREREGDAHAHTHTYTPAVAAVDDWRLLWRNNRRVSGEVGRGVAWTDVFTEEDLFAWRLLAEPGGWRDYLQYHWLRFRSAWGSEDAEEQLTQLVAIGLASSSSSVPLSSPFPRAVTTSEHVNRAVQLALKLTLNPDEEMASLVRGLGGEFVPAAPGGDVIRDGVGVLPTGRNIHALDPYRIPGEVAMARGRTAARLVIEAHQRTAAVAAVTGRGAATSAYPETVAVTLWGLDTIKTKGESIAIVLALVGAEPVREGTGRVVGFALTPLAQLGRPRIDVLGSLSGIFRDSFGNVLDLLDDMFERAAYCDEPEDMNFIKKHTAALAAKGVERPFSRLFSNPPGDFGSLVGDQIGAGDWSDATELGNTWQGRNAFSYGRQGASVGSQQQGLGGEGAGGGSGPTNGGGSGGGAEKGAFRPEVLSTLLSTTERIVQEIDSVEYGLTDIQEYYANTGALKKAAENNQAAGRRVAVSVIESFEKEVKPRDLEETLRLEYRSKLLNPKWAEAMAAQGAGGAYEISGRMTAMIGWAATTDFAEQWVFDGAADRYVLDEAMADRLRASNPEAFRNILKRMMEAKGRGFWSPSDDVLARLQDLFEEVEDEIEGVA